MVTVHFPMSAMENTVDPAPPSTDAADKVDLLILGAGWTSNFLIPLLEKSGIRFAATSTTGRSGTIPFRYDPDSSSPEPFRLLPTATTVLITFPLKGQGQSKHLTGLYHSTHQQQTPESTQWIQLGSTGIFTDPHWTDESSSYDKTNLRAIAEDELMASVPRATVLNLAGLYDGETRNPRNWLTRVARTKDAVRGKGALHLIHGADVARAIVAVHERFTPGRRWIIADLRTYDWWDLIQAWGADARERLVAKGEAGVAEGLDYERWVGELMQEDGIRALPRSQDKLGRVLDSRAFWKEMGTWPIMGRIE
ncbi:hypothetical protein MCOR27_007851 [Pyricularia oryzae]|uniref:Uncharacterized protein n=1 Tax=Pyricularia grisea TaxID=148305 RepID=A0ABQ8NFN2_PYRGI|nr:hypothetical protein MCOR02_003584 [Pyricularia oryzae]KAI6296324.1 hypothetical protein MCOR33_007054 [Pyricularia grisea]KAI6259659.1 hypothetical protein MCOR19_004013 [Pyricularia oryzae]KAI6273482.1 hypothetical protein MCOR27_007851 [Pyricularia oryzae]KAI6280096.1 hypothetical protein MCOR26_003902 [Pyricularia oryzae]